MPTRRRLAQRVLAAALLVGGIAPAPSEAALAGERLFVIVLPHDAARGDVVEAIPQLGIGLVRAPRPGDVLLGESGPVRPLDESADPYFSEQHALTRIEVPGVWNLTRGHGIRVAVLDSGLDLGHEDLAHVAVARVALPPYDGAAGDACGHGTAVSGILAAGLQNGVGIAGAADAVTLIPVRVIGNAGGCTGTTFQLAHGIVLAADAGAHVISISLSAGAPGQPASADVALAIAYARAKGALLVAAAGNGGGATHPPANHAEVVGVTCTSAAGGRCPFASHAQGADLAAPGDAILTTLAGGGYGLVSGTSYATPHVAATAALLLAATGAAPTAVREAMLAAAADVEPGFPPEVRASRALTLLSGPT